MKLLKINKFSKDFNKTSRHVVIYPPPTEGICAFWTPHPPGMFVRSLPTQISSLVWQPLERTFPSKMLLHYVPHFNRYTVEFASRKGDESKPGINPLLPSLKNITKERIWRIFKISYCL